MAKGMFAQVRGLVIGRVHGRLLSIGSRHDIDDQSGCV